MSEILHNRVDTMIELNSRQACDTELLMCGGFSPLTGFMNPDAYNSVVDTMRLPSGELFGLPVVFDVDTARDDIKEGIHAAKPLFGACCTSDIFSCAVKLTNRDALLAGSVYTCICLHRQEDWSAV